MKKTQFIIIAGPPGSGKSTVSEILANKFKKSVAFSNDTIRHFVKAGNKVPWGKDAETKRQLGLAEKVIATLADMYLKSGYIVIVDGIYSDKSIKLFRSKFVNSKFFILLPELDINLKRDYERGKNNRIPDRVKILNKYYRMNKFSNFQVIDNTSLSAQKTAQIIFNICNKKDSSN